MAIQLSDLVTATGGQIHGPQNVRSWSDFCHDSRLAAAGQLFVALRTPSGDGHDFIADAVAKGCTGVICQHLIPDHPAVLTLLAPDSGDALRAWAGYILHRYQPLVIAITGSSGKTTAKELTSDLLERSYPGRVFRSRESYNDRLGVPLALGTLEPHHHLAVIELGTDAHGEIADLTAIVRPTIAAITVIHDAHIGTFESLEAIVEEKSAIVKALPLHGFAIVNADDPLQEPLTHVETRTVLTHSSQLNTPIQLHSTATGSSARMKHSMLLNVNQEAITRLRGTAMAVMAGLTPANQTSRSHMPIHLHSNLLGEHNLVPIRTAVSIVLLLGVPVEEIVNGVQTFQPLPGRLCPIPGIDGSILLDDTYSASPTATGAALRTLADYPARQRLAILGEHSDLGPAADTHLQTLGPAIAEAVDYLIVVGQQARALAGSARTSGLSLDRIAYADTANAAADLALPLLKPGTVVLLKGSREARLERITALLMSEPDRASQLLVRQNPAWLSLRLRNSQRPTWVEIDTLALADNVRATRARLQSSTKLIAVLKADAYGHGAPTVARIVMQAGADMLAVACQPEAQILRRLGILAPILVLGYTPPWQVRSSIELDVQLTVYERDVADALNQAAMALGRRAKVHVKVDTGMGRLGLFPAEVPDFLGYLQTLSHVDVVGLFSHMAMADEPDDPHTDYQLVRFRTLLSQIEHLHLRPPLVHVANTATLLTRPDAHYDAVRLGIGLYGLAPGPGVPLPSGYRPALTWKTTIAQVKTLQPDSPIGYGLSYRTEGRQTIAVIPVGYADGFRRAPQHWGHVLVRGRRAPLVGRVSMDQAAIDVSLIPGVRSGDEVVLIGRQGDESISADDVAARLGTINYEVISAILARVPRLPE